MGLQACYKDSFTFYYLTKAEHGNLAKEMVDEQHWLGEQS
jgi:hypothetical protein